MAPGDLAGPGRAQTVLLLVHTVVVQAVTFMLRPASAYRALELDVPGAWLGVLGASFAVVPLLLAVPSGHAVDRFGERRIALAGSTLLAAAGLGFVLLAGSVIGLVVASMLLGTAHLCAVVAQQALVANRTPADRYDAAFGYYTFAASLGQALGPGLIVLFGGDRSIPDTRAIFLGATAVAVPLLVVALFLRPSGHHREAAAGPGAGGLRDLLRQPGLVRALTVSCVALAAVDISLVYLPALGTERGIAAGSIGVLLGVRAVASMASRLLLGRLVAALGRRVVLVGTVALSAVGIGLLLPPLPFPVLVLVVTVAGLGLGAGQPLTMSFLAEVAPPGLRGRAMSLRLTGNRLGQVLIPSAAGVLAAGAGAAGVLGCTAAGLGAAAVAATRLHRPPPASPSP
ncbi:MFS transporter [Micromonospora soli]|uniref:MFS transporter n=1 Tax=Micromonospora sp. NBRC 110009 TaxID=3061627 RepID=UPI0026733F13|nr:MFS transporter [Micromonospora sp. NBRC 110009]WKU01481.1 MFS transporter [Micromonospora sp. NBRC 110009]